ncbi:unnamed protein product [Polarella glacialis]|uniref:Uncharacterized protein n=1 Tax=Polarella glacialis TaxID=89957 RepID=A0A813L7X7_POLGL|nr:unnamed protein product [Polarella glacialis]CAE8610954.1 unnamed protein product [Polarella glacialis]CAE8639805.1 unnamed protein product [Polarella glacialis]CAE8717507.1 unnamed protein product [Polarella glacialis]
MRPEATEATKTNNEASREAKQQQQNQDTRRRRAKRKETSRKDQKPIGQDLTVTRYFSELPGYMECTDKRIHTAEILHSTYSRHPYWETTCKLAVLHLSSWR